MIEFIIYLFIFASILTYIVWGFIISFESILALNNTKSAINWIKKHHKPKTFKNLLILFLPMLYFGYILFEIIPYLLGIEKSIKKFDLENIFKNIFY